MYIRQNPLFSFDTLMQYQPQTRLSMLFEELNVYPAIQALPPKSIRGPKGYSFAALLRALLAKQVCAIPTVTRLVERLMTDLVFRYDCGFSTIGAVPSSATFSRFFHSVSQNQVLQQLFEQLVEVAMQRKLIHGDIVAIDASAITAYEKTVPKKNATNDAKHANWGAKRDTNGNQHAWFGYKVHLAIDTASELPLAVTVTPASHNDVTQALPLMDLLPCQPKYYCLDSGYDVKNIYENIRARSAQAIIPLNRRGEKLQQEGLDANRTPTCSMGYSMVYWGCDAKTGVLKFRCPHVCGKVSCPNGAAWCSNSNYGLVVKKKVSEDPRNFCTPHRETREWKKLYNERTSVERTFSRLKEHLGADLLRVRGIQKVTAHLLLCCIVLIAGTLAVNLKKEQAA